MSQYTGSIPVEDVHRWKADATQRLLGYTIGISDDAWHEPSPLPGWSRAHVATHLARAALEAGADRTGLELQIDLDTSAGALQSAIERVTYWTSPVVLHGRKLILAAVPLSRLHEVCVHHLDLDRDYSPDAIDTDAAAWLLRWVVDRLQDADLPALRVEGESLTAELGRGEDRRRVTGSDARLWAWLSGRLPAAAVSGTDGLQPALLA